jgi:hypothetical protein
VRVQWVETATADAHGLLNLRIRPWDSNWQTNDIWVDSKENNFGTYETATEASTGNPLGNGDRPWVEHENRIYARIHNFGVIPADDVQVTFYVNSPPGVGDSGTWVPHAVRTIPAIAAGASEPVFAPWYPAVDEHTCLKVAVETQLGETDVNDNDAQENVFNFDTSGASPHEPIYFETSVQNPMPDWMLVYLRPRGIKPGWEATVEHGWLWLPPLGTKTMKVALFTDIGRSSPLSRTMRKQDRPTSKISKDIQFKLQGGTYRWYGEGVNTRMEAEHLEATGGIMVNARARAIAELRLEADREMLEKSVFAVRGQLIPKVANARVSLEIVTSDKRNRVVQLTTNEDGRFSLQDRKLPREKGAGQYIAQAFLRAHDQLADTESPRIEFLIPEAS